MFVPIGGSFFFFVPDRDSNYESSRTFKCKSDLIGFRVPRVSVESEIRQHQKVS